MKTIKKLRKYNKLKTEIPDSCVRCLIRSNLELVYKKLLDTEVTGMSKQLKPTTMFGIELVLIFRCPCCARNLVKEREKDNVDVLKKTEGDSKMKPYKLTPFDNLMDESTDKDSINLALLFLNQHRGVALDSVIIDEAGYIMDFPESGDSTEMIHIDTIGAFPENNTSDSPQGETLPKIEIKLPEYLKDEVDNNVIKDK